MSLSSILNIINSSLDRFLETKLFILFDLCAVHKYTRVNILMKFYVVHAGCLSTGKVCSSKNEEISLDILISR